MRTLATSMDAARERRVHAVATTGARAQTKGGKPTGTQSIERAILLMKLLATRGNFGWCLTDLARRAGLDKATAHRILGCLEGGRLVERDSGAHRYFPGPMLVELGLSVSGYQPLLDEGRAAAERLARRSGGVGFFHVRSGSDFVVAARVEANVHRGMLSEVGMRRPLVTSVGGIAMLLAMPEHERNAVVECNLGQLAAMCVPQRDRYERMWRRSLALGYAANLEDVVPGVHGFSVPILDRAGSPLGSLAIAGEAGWFPATAGRKLLDLLSSEANPLSAKAGRPGASTRTHAAMAETMSTLT